MELNAESGSTSGRDALRGDASDQRTSPSGAARPAAGGGNVLLQLLEFKTKLLEVVEELHIRQGAHTRFEGEISKLVLEKQELEWEKESLVHQIEAVAQRHAETLNSMKNQFQARLRSSEEEKGKHQLMAELKEKDISSLKEELKTLQLLKYESEKKRSELEQKLSLQSSTKENQLLQLGQVEERFSALCRQCAEFKQAHQRLLHNVDEAMRLNKKLSSTSSEQKAAIASLKKELDEANKELVKAKLSSFRHEATGAPSGREQQFQQLGHKLNLETETNKKLREENLAEKAEKKEVMRALQHTQQLLLSQTQTVRRTEVKLNTQREMFQALKREHKAAAERSRAAEEELLQLRQRLAASQSSWDKEKATLTSRIASLKDAYRELQQKHAQTEDLSAGGAVYPWLFPASPGETGAETVPEDGDLQLSRFPHSGSPDRLREGRDEEKPGGTSGIRRTPGGSSEVLPGHTETESLAGTETRDKTEDRDAPREAGAAIKTQTGTDTSPESIWMLQVVDPAADGTGQERTVCSAEPREPQSVARSESAEPELVSKVQTGEPSGSERNGEQTLKRKLRESECDEEPQDSPAGQTRDGEASERRRTDGESKTGSNGAERASSERNGSSRTSYSAILDRSSIDRGTFSSMFRHFGQGSRVSETNPTGSTDPPVPPPAAVPSFPLAKAPPQTAGTSGPVGRREAAAGGDTEPKTTTATAAAPEMSNRALSLCTSSKLPWQAGAEWSRAPGDLGSQEREEQQSSLRAQISKIEQLLNAERLRLPKRPKTDD